MDGGLPALSDAALRWRRWAVPSRISVGRKSRVGERCSSKCGFWTGNCSQDGVRCRRVGKGATGHGGRRHRRQFPRPECFPE